MGETQPGAPEGRGGTWLEHDAAGMRLPQVKAATLQHGAGGTRGFLGETAAMQSSAGVGQNLHLACFYMVLPTFSQAIKLANKNLNRK